MAFTLKHKHSFVPRVQYADGKLHHVISEGARFHAPSWGLDGQRCSEPDCEINHGGIREYIECPIPPFGCQEREEQPNVKD